MNFFFFFFPFYCLVVHFLKRTCIKFFGGIMLQYSIERHFFFLDPQNFPNLFGLSVYWPDAKITGLATMFTLVRIIQKEGIIIPALWDRAFRLLCLLELRGRFLLGRGGFLLGRGGFLLGRGRFLLGRGRFLLGRGRFLLGRGGFLLGRGRFLLGRGRFLLGRGRFLLG